MRIERKWILLGVGALALLSLGAITLAMRGPPEAPAENLSSDVAAAYTAMASGHLALSTVGKVSLTVLAANGVPERNAPSFAPRKISVVGAAPTIILRRNAVVVRYRGDTEGDFAVISFPGTEADFNFDAGTIEYFQRRFTTFVQPGPDKKPLNGVGQVSGGRLIFVVGPQRVDVLAALAAAIPGV